MLCCAALVPARFVRMSHMHMLTGPIWGRVRREDSRLQRGPLPRGTPLLRRVLVHSRWLCMLRGVCRVG